jgi:hypothetical protein
LARQAGSAIAVVFEPIAVSFGVAIRQRRDRTDRLSHRRGTPARRCARKLSASDLERERLARAGRAGDQPVAVGQTGTKDDVGAVSSFRRCTKGSAMRQS